ncbi:MAG: hypothetical protein LBU28_10450 [Spirochaetaceae bacterium]|nr:hypothetical protein [Spirochaetaceae bacterium]
MGLWGLHGQEADFDAPASPPEEAQSLRSPEQAEGIDEVHGIYYIRTIDLDIQGRTKAAALIRKGELAVGERLPGKAALERYIARKSQLIYNQRVIEAVSIEYTLGEADEGGIPVDLRVITRDTRNFIILPEPQYDSNSGFDLTLKGRDYNFLGSMTPLRVDVGYRYSEEKEHSVDFLIDSDFPFQALGLNWNLNFDNELKYIQDAPLYFKNTTGLSLDLPVKRTTLTFALEQITLLNEENDDNDEIDDGVYYNEHWYTTSALSAQWEIPLGLSVGSLGELTYTPKLKGSVNYRPYGDIGEYRRGAAVTLSQTLGFGEINWIGNFRKGIEVFLDNANTYGTNRQSWNYSARFSAIGHFPVTDFFEITGRVMYRQWFFSPESIYKVYSSGKFHVYADGGDVLRGVKNNALPVENMLSLNLDFPLRVLRFVPSEWLHNAKLHLFDFELQIAPFIDIALVRDPVHERNFSPRDAVFAGGLEFIVFPLAWRSLYLRVSAGTNLVELFKAKKLFPGNNRELFIGLGHHF